MALSASQQIAIIKKKIEAAAREILENDVAPVVKEELINQGQQAYDDYSPNQYTRTGGLTNEDNIQIEVNDQNQLEVSFDYETRDGYNIPSLVEFGAGYNWDKGGVPARPIFGDAREELISQNKVTDAFKKGLKAKGIKTK